MLRDVAKKIPGLEAFYHSCHKSFHKAKTTHKISELKKYQSLPFIGNPGSNLVVSLTTFPARISTVWIAIETIFRQDYKPWKVVLTLSQEDFPDKKLPKELNQQIERGLEILWTNKNTKSFKKLLPAREAYPEAVIVTVDDDVFYEPWRLSQLIEAAKSFPGAVIGHRGCVVKINEAGLEPYTTWPQADKNTLPGRALLTGVGGILYPPHVMDEGILLNIDLALSLCPTADDIWFWVTALKSNVPVVCLGNHAILPIDYENRNSALSTLNCGCGQNDVQIKNVIDYFDLSKILGCH